MPDQQLVLPLKNFASLSNNGSLVQRASDDLYRNIALWLLMATGVTVLVF